MKLKMILTSPIMDNILESYKGYLGADYQKYRGHCYRLINYMIALGLGEEDLEVCQYAIPFHDLGIWTAQTMDYLAPSCEEAIKYIKKNNENIDSKQVSNIINNHHKITKIKGDSGAELLRKADLIDLTTSFVSFGIDKKTKKIIKQRFPYHGFQFFIYKKVMKHAIRNILNPFPMLKF